MQLLTIEGLSEEENKRFNKITQYKLGYHKLWSSDSGRSLTGAYSGTLIGIFPKITFKFGTQNNNDRALVLSVVNSQFKKITYYDTENKAYKTQTFYFSDAEDEISKACGDDMTNIRHKSFEVSAVATKRRS